ncbi:MAG TPA: STAS domain-containing protein [Spirochaetota bacterium]|nr:STAS domain-containing protein [Spirochaetota bacterium]HNT12504.1 STAS domain-containing protein [Spirochaetota bacterium]HNV49009.1 STAS domain-containing protein [Spirochaetota bacterium]HOS41807.1 STAS domain-containing protein [Spirochaetota bacterium]HPU88583.1 STAS domain-containing protein [Spirochaetota bacterium]
MRITANDQKNYVVLKIEGSFSNEHIKELDFQVNLNAKKKRHIMIDFTELSFISSSVLSALLLYNDQLRSENIVFNIFGLSENIRKMFDITGVSEHLFIFDSLDDAAADIRGTA